MSVLDRAKHSPEVLRVKRAKLFKAFDIYKQNVNYGLILETNERHSEIAGWYALALELDYNAIEEYPEELEKYL